MLDNYDPWQKIEEPANKDKLSRLRIENVNEDFYWAKSSNEEIGVIVHLSREPEESLLKKHQNSFENIRFFLLADKKHFWIFIQNSQIRNQFRALVHQVLLELQKNKPSSTAVSPEDLFLLFEKWSNLLKRKTKDKLSENAQRGLLGELYFLSRVLAPKIGIEAAVKSWCGPAGHEQDFNYHGHLYEIKTQLASSDKLVKVSSLEQLDTISGKIVLTHLGLSPVETQKDNCISIELLINEIESSLKGNNFLIDIFNSSLLLLGVTKTDELKSLYELSFISCYEISDEFPALRRSQIPLGILKAVYTIDISNLQDFKIPISKIFED